MEQKKRVIALGFFDGVHNGHAALMRRTAMNEKRKLVEIARSLITAAEMLK